MTLVMIIYKKLIKTLFVWYLHVGTKGTCDILPEFLLLFLYEPLDLQLAAKQFHARVVVGRKHKTAKAS